MARVAMPSAGCHAIFVRGLAGGGLRTRVKVRPKVSYEVAGQMDWSYLSGPECEVELRGFVDLRLDDVGEWGEEEPGAFMAKGGIEELTLRTCSARDVALCWNSDKIGLYTDPACEEQHRVVEDEGSLEGSRRATFAPTYPTPEDKDDWGAKFRTEELWAKALKTSDIPHDIHLTLSPVSGQAASDSLNLTVVEVEIVIDKEPGFHTKQIENGILEIWLHRAHIYGESKPSGADISDYHFQQNAYLTWIDPEGIKSFHAEVPDSGLINIPADEGYYDTGDGPTGPGGTFDLSLFGSWDVLIVVFVMEDPANSKSWGYDWSWDKETQELTAHDKGP